MKNFKAIIIKSLYNATDNKLNKQDYLKLQKEYKSKTNTKTTWRDQVGNLKGKTEWLQQYIMRIDNYIKPVDTKK